MSEEALPQGFVCPGQFHSPRLALGEAGLLPDSPHQISGTWLGSGTILHNEIGLNSFSKYSSSPYHVPGAVPGTEDTRYI